MRFLFFLLLVILAVATPWYVLFVFVVLYSFRYFALELIPLALAVDVYFGSTLLPGYTLGVLAILFALEWYKTYSSFYTA